MDYAKRTLSGAGLWLLLVALLAPSVALMLGMGSSGLTCLSGRGVPVAGNLGHSLLTALVTAWVAVLQGTTLAWVMVMYRFPGRKVLRFLIILPLAVPAYLAAYTQAGFLDINGPISRLLSALGITESFRWASEGAVALVTSLGFQLYPYVYLIALPADSAHPWRQPGSWDAKELDCS